MRSWIYVGAGLKMKALRWQHGRLTVDEVPRPEADGEVLVRVLKSGICNTDLEIARGYAGFQGTIGHSKPNDRGRCMLCSASRPLHHEMTASARMVSAALIGWFGN